MASSTEYKSIRDIKPEDFSVDWDAIRESRRAFWDAERRKQEIKEAAYREAAREGGFSLVRRLMRRYGRIDR